MIVVMGNFRLPLDRIAQALPLMEQVVRETRSEDGCLLYAYAQDTSDPGPFRVCEQWRNREALARHFDAPHMERWKTERAALGLFDRNMRAFNTDEGEAL